MSEIFHGENLDSVSAGTAAARLTNAGKLNQPFDGADLPVHLIAVHTDAIINLDDRTRAPHTGGGRKPQVEQRTRRASTASRGPSTSVPIAPRR